MALEQLDLAGALDGRILRHEGDLACVADKVVIGPLRRHAELILGAIAASQLDVVRRFLGDPDRDRQHALVLGVEIGSEVDRTEEAQAKNLLSRVGDFLRREQLSGLISDFARNYVWLDVVTAHDRGFTEKCQRSGLGLVMNTRQIEMRIDLGGALDLQPSVAAIEKVTSDCGLSALVGGFREGRAFGQRHHRNHFRISGTAVHENLNDADAGLRPLLDSDDGVDQGSLGLEVIGDFRVVVTARVVEPLQTFDIAFERVGVEVRKLPPEQIGRPGLRLHRFGGLGFGQCLVALDYQADELPLSIDPQIIGGHGDGTNRANRKQDQGNRERQENLLHFESQTVTS